MGEEGCCATRCGGRQRQTAARRILERVSQAFGVMMLDKGLFQADAHPGNILVMKGAQCTPLPRRAGTTPGARLR